MSDVTVVIPTFNREAMLVSAVESALAQSDPPPRILIADNASTDRTQEVCEQLVAAHPSIRYLRRAVNIGAVRNFHEAAADVDTPFVNFLSDDDLLLPDFHRHALEELERDTEAGYWSGATLIMRGAQLVDVDVASLPEGRFEQGDIIAPALARRTPVWTGTVFRTSALRAAGGVPSDVPVPDVALFLAIADARPGHISHHPSAILNLHSSSQSFRPDQITGVETIAAVLERTGLQPSTRIALAANAERGLASMAKWRRWGCYSDAASTARLEAIWDRLVAIGFRPASPRPENSSDHLRRIVARPVALAIDAIRTRLRRARLGRSNSEWARWSAAATAGRRP